MRLLATPLAVTLAAAVSLTAFSQTFTDPANLRGERPTPRNGRELPIDGGLEADGRPNPTLALAQLLRRISTRASILNIVAHPDDEDGGMLTFYARGLGARVADLSLTRGEGGQNAMTGDFEDALGLLRTQELLANDRYTGVSQMFGTEVDFGFSKTKSEAFAKWTHQRVLYDAVRAIRLYRPLVITSTWTGGITDGHGQHQVSGEIAQEAFLAAGDPTVFPELTAQGILPWQPLRMYARVPQQAITPRGLYDYATNQYVPARFTNYITGVTSSTPPSTDIVVHEGDQDPLLTRSAAHAADLPPASASLDPDTPFSYIQFARIGLGLQKSQIGPNFRVPKPGAKFDVPYHLYGSKVPVCDSAPQTRHSERSAQREVEEPTAPSAPASCQSLSTPDPTFFTGIDTSLASLATLTPNPTPQLRAALASIAGHIAAATTALNTSPAAAAPNLAEALSETDTLLAAEHDPSLLHELRIKRVQLNDALILALGLRLTARADAESLLAGHIANAQVHVTEQWPIPVLFHGVTAENSRGHGISDNMDANEDESAPTLAPGQPVDTVCGIDASQANSLTRPYFSRDSVEVPVYTLANESLREGPATPPALTCGALITYNGLLLDLAAVANFNTQPADIVPPASVALPLHAEVLPARQTSLVVAMNVTPPGTPVKAEVPSSWTVQTSLGPNSYMAASRQFHLDIPLQHRAVTTVRAVATLPDNTEISEGYRPVGYGDLPRTNYYTPAADRIVPVDLKLPATTPRIAYLPGTGDAVPAALASIGLAPAILTVADLTPASLARFDTVILGVRTYNAHPDLHGAPTQALLDFARAGGNVLVQYQTPEFTAADAPYPLDLGDNEKVVDENAPVALIAPTAPTLNTPNRITPADFDGWIEERGHGFLSTWDTHYTALTETHDPGAPSEDIAPQKPQRGGLITTQLGKGRWTYCAFALYRQLPEAVPGAYRLFLNLIAP